MEENGYIVLLNAVPMENLTAGRCNLVLLEIDPSNPKIGILNLHAGNHHVPRIQFPDFEYGMVEIYQHLPPVHRQYPRIHQHFKVNIKNSKLHLTVLT